MPKKIISVISGKGGVGKSSLAVNLSILLAKSGVSTLLIDADIFNPCVFFHLGISPQSVGMGELLEGKSSLEEVFSIHPGSGLRVISSSIQTYGKIKSERLGKIIDSLNYEYIIIDCPPGFSPLIREAVALSSHIYVVLTPDMPSCSAALKLVTFIRNYVSGKAAFTYFLNRMSNVPYAIHPREVESLFRARLGSIIPEDPNVPKSIASKTPLVLMDPNSKFSKALRAAVPSLLHNRDHRFDMVEQPPSRIQPIAGENGGGLPGLLRNLLQRLQSEVV